MADQAAQDSGGTDRRQGGTAIGGSADGDLLAGAPAARDIVGGRTEADLEAEARRMVETERVQRERERESEERDGDDPDKSSGPEIDSERPLLLLRL